MATATKRRPRRAAYGKPIIVTFGWDIRNGEMPVSVQHVGCFIKAIPYEPIRLPSLPSQGIFVEQVTK
jgi:hypothetical protein